MSLEKFLYKYVWLEESDGTRHPGFVGMYCEPYEDDSPEACIGVLPRQQSTAGIILYESEIKDIAVINDKEEIRRIEEEVERRST